ncbi:hypothetical protein LZ009_20035 [Ramlibacter sp. XY19]|uniref:hypothetical protein n=1 Tax=Ramlibacter paludis TaxID=2908000 RepID=UPI0023DC96D0|nr:hypothetical protein [Ramlibacter paludis]MCG2595075.1 hypothetical protein [Ramlibacter paludis]
MGLLKRIFGTNETNRDSEPGAESAQFHESVSTSNEAETSRNAPRRELIQVLTRDVMRKHGIPSDWLECRILSTVTRSGRAGLHVNFVVRQAHEQLLGYVFAFQDSFLSELARFEPRARDWLVSVGWEFEGHGVSSSQGAPAVRLAGAPPPQSGRVPLVPPAQPRAFAPTDDAMVAELPRSDEDMQQDLQALFAIRDAAIADAAKNEDRPDFEQTRPFEDTEAPPPSPQR